MKILLVTGNYLPAKSGGIENYVHLLSKLLIQNGHVVHVAALETFSVNEYVYDAVPVTSLLDCFLNFERLIERGQFDICHFHEYSGKNGINITWFHAAKKKCKKVFFTFHLPYLTCYKADFRYFGLSDCNTFSSANRCANCVIATKLQYKGAPGFNFKNSSIHFFLKVFSHTKYYTTLKKKISVRQNELNELINTCDEVFVIANWFKEILNANRFISEKIKVIPSLITIPEGIRINISDKIQNRIVFVGRIESQKGLLLLCKALKLNKSITLKLDVFGNITDQQYFNQCKNEFNFNYRGTMQRIDLLNELAEYDFMVVPSVAPEMYPMAVKESMLHSLPVIASGSKGNLDLISDTINGFIFEYGNYHNLATIINKAYQYKINGWRPKFSIPSDKDQAVLLSYYK